MSKNSNSVAVINPKLFGDIDFTKLSGTISSLAAGSAILNDKEKEMAVSVIAEWESDVIRKLQEKRREARTVVDFFEVNTYYSSKDINLIFSDDQLSELATRNGFTGIFRKYEEAKKAINDLEYPLEPVIELDTTLEQKLLLETTFHAEVQKYQMLGQTLNRQKALAVQKLIEALRKVKEVQELLTRVKEFESNVSGMYDKCKELSQVAKLNVVISSDQVRESLKEMLKFGAEL